jgi:flagellar biosynthesis protein FliR
MAVSIPQAQQFFLALTRVFAILVQVPVLAGSAIPNPVKIGFGILTTLVILPWQPLPAEAATLPLVAFGLAVGREMLIGTLAGFAATLIFSAFQITGEMMDLTSGFAAARLINPAFENTGSPLNQFFYLTATIIFLVINGHHSFLIGLQKTFVILPLNGPLPAFTSDRLMSLTGGLITAGIQMSLPLAGAMLLADLALGLLARVAPQIQVFFLGVPLKVGLGLLILPMAMIYLLPAIIQLFHALAGWMLYLLGA